jgi:CRISPR-associated protein Csx10
MSGYEVTITAKSELAMAPTAEVAFVSGTHRYVPGHIVLAGLAGRWIREHGTPADATLGDRDAFEAIFHSDVRFGPALADGSAVVPISVRRNKLQHSQVMDQAFPASPALPATTYAEDGKGQVDVEPGSIVRLTRTELEFDPGTGRRERAKKGQLFSRRAIRRGTTLRGVIVGRHPWLDALAADGSPTTVWLGGRRSTGGKATLTLSPGLTQLDRGPVGERTVIRLSAPGLFVDDETRPALEPAPSDWQRIFDAPGAVVHDSWTRPQRLGGWHAASGLPRPEELAAAPGSTYLVSVPAAAAPDWPERLRRLGLGLRTNEGYGFAELCRSPWEPPAKTQGPDGERPVRAQEVVERHWAVLADDRQLRRWTMGVLQDVLAGGRAGRPLVLSDAQPEDLGRRNDELVRQLQRTARVQQLSEKQRDAVADLARLPPADLREALVLLDDANSEVLQP